MYKLTKTKQATSIRASRSSRTFVRGEHFRPFFSSVGTPTCFDARFRNVPIFSSVGGIVTLLSSIRTFVQIARWLFRRVLSRGRSRVNLISNLFTNAWLWCQPTRYIGFRRGYLIRRLIGLPPGEVRVQPVIGLKGLLSTLTVFSLTVICFGTQWGGCVWTSRVTGFVWNGKGGGQGGWCWCRAYWDGGEVGVGPSGVGYFGRTIVNEPYRSGSMIIDSFIFYYFLLMLAGHYHFRIISITTTNITVICVILVQHHYHNRHYYDYIQRKFEQRMKDYYRMFLLYIFFPLSLYTDHEFTRVPKFTEYILPTLERNQITRGSEN